jgi:hypothetical protein
LTKRRKTCPNFNEQLPYHVITTEPGNNLLLRCPGFGFFAHILEFTAVHSPLNDNTRKGAMSIKKRMLKQGRIAGLLQKEVVDLGQGNKAEAQEIDEI